MKEEKKEFIQKLVNQIKESILNKKGKEIVCIDLRETGSSLCDFFILCTGDSSTQLNAIAEGIEADLKKTLSLRPHHKEGQQNAQWVLLDYLDVVVHIFRKEYREFYKLESLWADGQFEYVEDEITLEANKNDR